MSPVAAVAGGRGGASAEPEIPTTVATGAAFFACGREYKLRWWALFMHLAAWSGCAWAVVAASRGGDGPQEEEDPTHKLSPPQASSDEGSECGLRRRATLWPPPLPPAANPAPPVLSRAALPPAPSALFAARAAALSPLVAGACLTLAVLCADADLDAGGSTAPGVMRWWEELSSWGTRPLTARQERKYAAVQASAAGWVMLAACDAAWALAGAVFAGAAAAGAAA